MGRDKGKGKDRGGRGNARGGERMFIANEEELEIREREVQEQKTLQKKRRGVAEEEENNQGKEENVEQGDAGESVFSFDRSNNASAAKASAEGDDEEEARNMMGGLAIDNPNRTVDPNNPQGLNRKEREALAAQKAKEDYLRRHMAGETEQAKKELAQLAQVRARREAAAKKREEEGRAPGWTASGVESSSDSESGSDDENEEDKAAKKKLAAVTALATATKSEVLEKKKAKALGADEEGGDKAADGGPAKLKAMDIKKLNGDALKDHLKARGLDIQGQKKDLMKRLLDYEASRP